MIGVSGQNCNTLVDDEDDGTMLALADPPTSDEESDNSAEEANNVAIKSLSFVTMLKFTAILAAMALLAGCVSSFSMSMNADNSKSSGVVDRRSFGVGAATIAAATVLAPNLARADDDPYADFASTESGLKYKVTKEGTGKIPEAGMTVQAHYTGWLDGFDSIKKFDSSRDRGRPFSFSVGKGQVIRGWDEAFSGMAVGERRQLVIPPRLGYGDRGAGGIIPGGATLYFDVELLAIK